MTERITNGLRTWTNDHFGIGDWRYESIMEFADRIDAELAERYVELPKDADGEYIHVGDRLEHTNGIFTANDMTISIDGIWRAWDGENGHTVLLAKCRHHKQPTVEDVLRDMHAKLDEVTALYVGEAIDSDERDSDEARIIAEYAAKLQLKENA